MNKRVIITRQTERAAPLISELQEHGVEAYAVAVTRVGFLQDLEIPENLDDYDVIAFTSVNAVNAFKAIINGNNIEVPGNIKFAAVGEATATEVKDMFGKLDIVPDVETGSGLAQAIIESCRDTENLKVFQPRAKIVTPEFEAELKKAGACLTPYICYETVEVDKRKIKSSLEALTPWDLVFFAAPSAVTAFSEAWEDRAGFVAVAIGPTTETALKKKGYGNIVVSKGTSAVQCAGAIVDALGLKIWS